MDTSIFIARLLGVTYLAVGVGLLFGREHYDRLFKAVSTETLGFYVAGLFALFFGYFIVSFHNLWVADWRVVITVIGWLGLIKGISLLAFPNAMKRMTTALVGMRHVMTIEAVFVLILGAYCTYFGFIR